MTKLTQYRFGTDSETGFLHCIDFRQACRQLDTMLPISRIVDGGWGWVEDIDGCRYERNLATIPRVHGIWF